MRTTGQHIPVMADKVVEIFEPALRKKFIDATAGSGGHSERIVSSGAKVLAIEKDPILERLLAQRLEFFASKQQVVIVRGDYKNIKTIAQKYKFMKVNGILFDLGMSSWHLESSLRGFSFQKDEPLDMRYEPSEGQSAEQVLNRMKQSDLEKIFRDYSQERYASRIARAIVRERSHHSFRKTSEKT